MVVKKVCLGRLIGAGGSYLILNRFCRNFAAKGAAADSVNGTLSKNLHLTRFLVFLKLGSTAPSLGRSWQFLVFAKLKALFFHCELHFELLVLEERYVNSYCPEWQLPCAFSKARLLSK